MFHLNIFNNVGLPRTDIPDTAIAKLDKAAQLPAFMQVMTAYPDTLDADAAFIVAEKAKRAAISNLKRLMDAHEKIAPKRTFYDEWKKTVAKIPEPAPDPEIAKRVAASLKTIDKANAALEQSELDLREARKAREDKRKAFALAIMAWSRVDGKPHSVGDLIKARSATERKIAMDNIAAGLPPDHAVAEASTIGNSHWDRFRAGQGKVAGHSANLGYHRNALRGANISPKLPSDR